MTTQSTYATQTRERVADRLRASDPVVRASEHVLANVILAGRSAAHHERLLALAIELVREGWWAEDEASFRSLLDDSHVLAHPDDRQVLRNVGYALAAWSEASRAG